MYESLTLDSCNEDNQVLRDLPMPQVMVWYSSDLFHNR